MKWFVFYNGQLLLQQQGDALQVPEGDNPPVPVPAGHQVHEVTMDDGVKVKTYELEEEPTVNGQRLTVNGQWAMVNGQWLAYVILSTTFLWKIISAEVKPHRFFIGTSTVASAPLVGCLPYRKRPS